jgi:hypothetical protein
VSAVTEANLLEQLHQYRQQETHDILHGEPDDKYSAACSCNWESPLYWDYPWQAQADWEAHRDQQTQSVKTYMVQSMSVRESWITIKATSPEQAKRIIMAEAGMAEPLAVDPEFNDVGDYAFPQPMDELAFWIDDIREDKEGQ